jgi:hypothetical protein
MKERPDPYPDLVPRKQIAQYLFKRTGTRVSEQRIGRWIAAGEIPMIRRPRNRGGGLLTRKYYLDELISRHSA